MGVLDKLKNALFEVEYVEVEEPPKKEKKAKVKKEKEKQEEKPIAKKIILPGKREEKIEELEEEELKDEDFEIRPKDEKVVEKPREEFKYMDDKDFEVEEDILDEPEILQVIEPHDKVEMLDKEDEEYPEDKKEDNYESSYSPSYYSNTRESKPYGMDTSYNVPVHEYGTYEKREEKAYFKPSPIISPIYGILDKNYKKEDVVSKKEVRITTNYSRSNVSVDDIRNKAYGDRRRQDRVVEEEPETKFEVEEEEEDNVLVDLSDRSKPEVKELTMGDAMEYFQDLGLEYNVDYVDVSKEKNSSKKVKEDVKEETEEELENYESAPSKEVGDSPVIEEEEEATNNIVEIKDESKNVDVDTIEEDNDNLFDLIDSMYQEKD